MVEWHIHHVNGNGENKDIDSGWKSLRRHERDYRCNKELEVVDRACHIAIHENEDLDSKHLEKSR